MKYYNGDAWLFDEFQVRVRRVELNPTAPSRQPLQRAESRESAWKRAEAISDDRLVRRLLPPPRARCGIPQTARQPGERRPVINNLYDVFMNIRDDEAEHCVTMRVCQKNGALQSPHDVAQGCARGRSPAWGCA